MSAMNMNHEQFNQIVREEKKLALIEYSAPWCVYCRRIAPAFNKLSEQYADRMTIAQVNIDDEPDLAKEYQIELVPTLVLYKDGEPVDHIVAPESKAKIEEFMAKYL